EDPEGMILAQNVVPLVRADIADEISDVINAVSAQLSTEDLIALNASSVVDQLDAATIATDWLTTTGLL
ncbi:MAG: glycine/betaine ABC transporter, partial [Actinomycetales bacterium]|nr:glycine/betaine ABC transporter [Actinomycetales bacterium]